MKPRSAGDFYVGRHESVRSNQRQMWYLVQNGPLTNIGITAMKNVSLIFAMLLLAACSTPGELRARAPVFDEVINAPAERLVGCLADQLESFRKGVTTRPTSNGYSISAEGDVGLWGATGGRDTVFVIDIAKADNKSHVKFFSGLAFSSGNERVISFIRKCI